MIIKNEKVVNIENAKIFWKNFSGKESRYNRKGDRNFEVEIPDETVAQEMLNDGWNIKVQPPREEGDSVRYHMPVSVSYRNYPPNIYKVTSHSKVLLDEESVGSLDRDEIINVDVVIRGSSWEVNENTGVKAYVRDMYVTIEENIFANKYEFSERPEEY